MSDLLIINFFGGGGGGAFGNSVVVSLSQLKSCGQVLTTDVID